MTFPNDFLQRGLIAKIRPRTVEDRARFAILNFFPRILGNYE